MYSWLTRKFMALLINHSGRLPLLSGAPEIFCFFVSFSHPFAETELIHKHFFYN
jgi:hypothetical protein